MSLLQKIFSPFILHAFCNSITGAHISQMLRNTVKVMAKLSVILTNVISSTVLRHVADKNFFKVWPRSWLVGPLILTSFQTWISQCLCGDSKVVL